MKKRIIALLLAITACLTTALTSCSCNGNEDLGSSSSDGGLNEQTQSYGKTHDFTMTETENYLVENGQTDYVLVLPENAGTYEKVARDEFIEFFRQATGIKIKAIQENEVGLTHDANAKYISLGNTKLLETAALEVDYTELGTQGVRILTKDKSVYLIGGGSQGVLYAVYDFMQLMFNFEIYAADYWVIDQNVRNLKLYDFNVTDVPDIELRVAGWSPIYNNVNNAGYRFRSPKSYQDYFMPVGDTENGAGRVAVHNVLDILPLSAGRAEWYSPAQDQICFTAHGNEEAFEQMVDRIAYVVEQSLIYYTPELYPDFNTVTITQEDMAPSCNCDGCVEAKNKYGAISGAEIVLCNRVMEKVDEWMQKPENSAYKRDLTMVFFAYTSTVDPPTHYDEATDKYVANHPDLTMRDDVGVFVALNKEINALFDYKHESTAVGRDIYSGWFALAKEVYLWTYATNYLGYIPMCDTFSLFNSDLYRYFVQGGAKYMFNQGSMSRPEESVTGFDGLKMFLDYKLMWNCSLDSGELIDEYFQMMYKEGAPLMRELFEEERTHSRALYIKYLKGKLDMTHTNASLGSTSYWSVNLLTKWMDKCTDAIALVEEKYAIAAPELCETIKTHIELEYCSPAFYLLQLYPTSLDPLEKAEILDYMKDIVNRVGDIRISERSGTVNTGGLKYWLENNVQ